MGQSAFSKKFENLQAAVLKHIQPLGSVSYLGLPCVDGATEHEPLACRTQIINCLVDVKLGHYHRSSALDAQVKFLLAKAEGHLGAMSIRATIISQIEQVAGEHEKTLAPLTDDLALFESGLDSLTLAILVVRLEELFGFDPYTELTEVHYPTTLGELIRLYEKCGAAISRRSEQAS